MEKINMDQTKGNIMMPSEMTKSFNKTTQVFGKDNSWINNMNSTHTKGDFSSDKSLKSKQIFMYIKHNYILGLKKKDENNTD